MNYGMYMAASAVSTNMARQDVLSNNLANVNTVGFRPDQFIIRQRDPVRIEDNLPFMDSDRLLERLGAGVAPMATRVSQSQGPLQQTGGNLDVAIEGEGFFVVRVADSRGDGIRLTRDGRLTVGPNGRLVTAAGGATVLGEGDVPIVVDRNRQVAIDGDGRVRQDGRVVGRLRIDTVPRPESLVKDGDNLFTTRERTMTGRRPATGQVVQGTLEMSGTDTIRAMIAVTSASQAAQSGLNVIASINEMMGRAISLGRVSGN